MLSRNPAAWVSGFLQSGQSRRTRRWAMKPRTDVPMRNGSTPMSINRVMPLTASFVWRVLKTR